MGSLVFIIIFSLVGLLFFSLGLIVHKYKQYDLISGYNTMKEDMKARFKIESYARIFGIVFYAIGTAIIMLTLVFNIFQLDKTYVIWFSLAIIFAGIIYLNVMGWRYKRESRIQ